MNQPDNIPSLLGEALQGAIRQAVREEIQSLIRRDDHESDRLLTRLEPGKRCNQTLFPQRSLRGKLLGGPSNY